MKKKLSLSMIILLLFFGGFHTHAEAKSPNAKDCIENPEDCSEPAVEKEDNIGENMTESTKTGNQSLIVDLVKMALALLLVLALIYFLLKLLNKRNNLSQQKSLQNLGGISVGPSKSIQIIKVGTKLYLIGVGDNVEMLQEITDESLIEELSSESSEQGNLQIGTFISNLSKLKPKTKNESTHPTDQQFKELFSNELASLKENRNHLIKQYKTRKDNNV